jgi:hypothetical protein
MTPLLLVCSLCLPLHSATADVSLGQRLQLSDLARGHRERSDEVGPPPSWETPAVVAAMGASAIGGNALAATRGFDVGRLVIDETSMVAGSLVGIGLTVWGSFLFGPEGGGLLLPLSERKLFTVLLVGGVVGSVGALAAAEAIAGRLDHPLGLLGAAGGFVVSSGLLIALVDGIFGLPVWANAILLPLGLVGGGIGGYSLAIPRQP